MANDSLNRHHSDYRHRWQDHSCLVSRRQVLKVALASFVGGSWFLRALPAVAQASPTHDIGRHAQDFLHFSHGITGHDDLNPLTARRIYDAMAAASADFAGQVDQLTQLISRETEPEALLASADSMGLRDTALAIVAAWYTGSVGSDSDAPVVAYRDALMYRPVSDGQVVPTYCSYGPAWWVVAPPAAGVSAPVEKAADKAPTTGVPVPTTDKPAAPKSTPQASN